MCSVHKAAGKFGSERFFLITLWESQPVIFCCDISLPGGSRCGILGSITDHMSFQGGMSQYPVTARALVFFSKQDYDLKSVVRDICCYIKRYIPMYACSLPCYVYLLSDDIQNLILCAYFISTVLWIIDNFITNILTFLFTFPFSELSK